MTQGNCGRVAAGTRPDSSDRGASAPRPAPRLLPARPPPASQRSPGPPRAVRPSLRRSAAPPAPGPGDARRVEPNPEGRRTDALASALRARDAPGSRQSGELCTSASNYLSELQAGGGPSKVVEPCPCPRRHSFG